MKKRNMIVRIFAIILCVLMALSAVVVGISTWANSAEVVPTAVSTGSNDKPMVIVAALAVVAVAAIAAVVISSGKTKKVKPAKENADDNGDI